MIGLENYENILKESCLFHNKDTAELAELCRLLGGKIQDYGKGQQLLHEGDTIKQLGIVLEGEVRIVRIDIRILTPSSSRGSPTETVCAKMWFLWILTRSSSGINFLQLSPRPVVIP